MEKYRAAIAAKKLCVCLYMFVCGGKINSRVGKQPHKGGQTQRRTGDKHTGVHGGDMLGGGHTKGKRESGELSSEKKA